MSEPAAWAPGRMLAAWMLLAYLLSPSTAAFAANSSDVTSDAAGAYCPLPAPGEQPACLAPARSQYAHFMDAIDAGSLDAVAAEQVERDLTSGPRTYLALTSLAYGYYHLAQTAAQKASPTPVLVARLEHWNDLLSTLYAETSTDPGIRRAVREAATDLHERAPVVSSECAGRAGADGSCGSAGTLLDALQAIDAQQSASGVRGALTRLIQRFRSTEADADAEGESR
jgi:hypothetical protein